MHRVAVAVVVMQPTCNCTYIMQVRTISLGDIKGRVAYSLRGPGAHWCENVERRHRSNTTYYVLDFVRGNVYQKCFGRWTFWCLTPN
jgi:hypothetical protein